MSGQLPAPSPRILVAEDVAQNRELVRAYLAVVGRDADFVSDGERAVAAVRSRVYSLVLMDVRMPRMDGIAAARAIRALPGRARTVPIIAMTANVWPEQIRAIEAVGMNGYVSKPIEIDAFARALVQFLHRPGGEGGPDAACPDGPVRFTPPGLADFRALMGAEQTAGWVVALSQELHSTFFDQDLVQVDRAQLARRAHAIVAQAGFLGFPDLARRCAALEQACAGAGDIISYFTRAKRAAARVRKTIALAGVVGGGGSADI